MAHRTAFYYDSHRNLRCVLDPENGLTYYTYDGDNRMTSVKKPWGEATYYEYTPGARMTKRILGLRQAWWAEQLRPLQQVRPLQGAA